MPSQHAFTAGDISKTCLYFTRQKCDVEYDVSMKGMKGLKNCALRREHIIILVQVKQGGGREKA